MQLQSELWQQLHQPWAVGTYAEMMLCVAVKPKKIRILFEDLPIQPLWEDVVKLDYLRWKKLSSKSLVDKNTKTRKFLNSNQYVKKKVLDTYSEEVQAVLAWHGVQCLASSFAGNSEVYELVFRDTWWSKQPKKSQSVCHETPTSR